MFVAIEGFLPLFLTLALLAIFAVIFYRRPIWAAAFVLFLLPVYLLKIGHWPATLLELLLWVFFLCWAVKKSRAVDGFRNFIRSLYDFFGPAYLVGVVLIIVGTVIGAVLSVDWRIGAGIWKSWIIEPVIFSLILSDVVKNRQEMKCLITGFCLAVVTAAVAGLIYKISGRLTFDGRLTGWYLSPNHLAMFLAPGLILTIWQITAAGKKIIRALWFGAAAAVAAALYLTFSYGAWLGTGAAAMLVLFYRWRDLAKETKIIIGLALAAVFLLVVAGEYGGEKFFDLWRDNRSSWQSRMMIWRSAVKILADNWIWGIGPGLFQAYYLEYQRFFAVSYLEWAAPQPHNLFLAWWLAGGLMGVAGFAILTAVYFKIFFLAEQKQPLAIFLAAVFVYILVHGLADTPYWKNDLALVFWFIAFLGYRAVRCRD